MFKGDKGEKNKFYIYIYITYLLTYLLTYLMALLFVYLLSRCSQEN